MPQIIAKRREGYKQQVEKLRVRVQELQQRHNRLQQTHSSLLLENAVVTALCESLSCLDLAGLLTRQDQQKQQVQEQDPQDVEVCEQFHKLANLVLAESQLLQQLCSMPPRQADHKQLLMSASADARHNPTIAPAHQPMALLTRCRSRMLDAATVQSLTSTDMTGLYKETVEQLAIHLQLLEANMISPDAAALRIETTCDKLLCTLFSCGVMGKGPLLREYCIRNAETMEAPNPTALIEQAPKVAAAVNKMQLTVQQEEAIAQHWPVWMRLLTPLKQEYQALQHQVCTADDINTSEDASHTSTTTTTTTSSSSSKQGPDGAAGTSCTPQGGLRSAHHQGGVSRAAEIEARMQHLERLQLVLHKIAIINLCCTCWLLGRLSWAQLAKLVVLTWPYPTSFDAAGAAIRLQWEKRCQRDREQQEQQLQAAVDDSVAKWSSLMLKERPTHAAHTMQGYRPALSTMCFGFQHGM